MSIEFVSIDDIEFNAELLYGFKKRLEKVLGIAGVVAAWTRNIAERLAHLAVIHVRVEKIVDPAQGVHGIGNIVEANLCPLIHKRTIDALSGHHFAQMTHVVVPGWGDAGADEMLRTALQHLLGNGVRPVLDTVFTHHVFPLYPTYS